MHTGRPRGKGSTAATRELHVTELSIAMLISIMFECHQQRWQLLVLVLNCPSCFYFVAIQKLYDFRTVRPRSILRMILVAPRTTRPRRSSSSGALMPHAYDTTCRWQRGIQPLPNTAIALPNQWYTCTAPWDAPEPLGTVHLARHRSEGKAMCDVQ